MSKNYTIPANTDWITLADLMGTDYDSTQYYVIHVNEITNGLLQYTCRLDMPTNEDIGQQFSNFSTIKVGTDVGDYTFLKATDTPIDVEVFVGSEDEPSPTPTPEITTGGVLPKNIAGLDYLLDGEYNLVTGSDHTNLNTYNLVKPSYTTTIVGTCDVSNGVTSFTDKSFVPAGTFFTPNYRSDYFSWDFVIKFSEAPLSFNTYCSLVHVNSGAPNGGYSIHINAEENARELVFMASTATATNAVLVAAPQFWESDKICYFTVTSNVLTGETKLYKNGEETQNYSTDTHLPYKLSTSEVNTGLFGIQSAQSNSTNTPTSESQMWVNGAFLFPNINVYTIRHWNRILTSDEIKQNYLQDKKRFG